MIVSAYVFADGVEFAPEAIGAAAQALRAGRLIGLPTETVYGLGADADNATAVAAIFEAKGRPSDHPLIVHVAAFDGGMSGVAHYAGRVPSFAQQLMSAFWPGPLTLILPRREGVGAIAAGGQNTIGLRCPAHPVAQAVLAALRQPTNGEAVVWGVAAPSANRFGRISPTTAQHVASEFADSPELLILDGGPCEVGIESTIIDCTRGAPVLLRPGAITSEQVAAACGRALISPEELEAQGQAAPRASGTLESHYAPNAKLSLMTPSDIAQALAALAHQAQGSSASNLGLIAVWLRTTTLQVPSALTQLVLSVPRPQEAAACAHDLFAQLRRFDEQGASQIWVEAPPTAPAWDGVRDRLMRAATP